MEIIDVNFNFEDMEKLVKTQRKKCNIMVNKLEQLIDIHDDMFQDAEPTQENINDEQTLVYNMIETLEKLNAETDKFIEIIDIYVATMQARINYIEQNITMQELENDSSLIKEFVKLVKKRDICIAEKNELTNAIADLNTDVWGEGEIDYDDACLAFSSLCPLPPASCSPPAAC